MCLDANDMIWEGGPAFDDGEPSRYWEPIMPVVGKYSIEKTEYLFTCLIALAIRHVKKFFFNRVEVATEPTIAQQVGEFVTGIRRELRTEKYAFLDECGFKNLTDTDMWSNVGIPHVAGNAYKWAFNYYTTEGVQQMYSAYAQIICENAAKIATSDKTIDEEFREINNDLNNLMRETTALNSLVYRAKDLNAQAVIVVDNLYSIAEKLNQE